MYGTPQFTRPCVAWYLDRHYKDLGSIYHDIRILVLDEVNVIQEIVRLLFRQYICKALESKEFSRRTPNNSLGVLTYDAYNQTAASSQVVLQRNQQAKSLYSAGDMDWLIFAAL